METFADIQQQYQEALSSLYDEGEIKALFLMALEHVSGMRRSQFLADRNKAVSEVVRVGILAILEHLQEGQPIQHVLGEAHFYGMRLVVTPDTLIPRTETEELVKRIIEDFRGRPLLSVMDIGTGSGCIAVALAKNLPAADVWAVDVSPKALAVARQNAFKQKQEIRFLCADVLEWGLTFPSDCTFDIIVSNPPYITPKEKEQMSHNVLLYEPHTALFVDEETPLLFYDHIADYAWRYLKDDGSLYFEINQYLGAEMVELLHKKGFGQVELLQDMHGNDRIVIAKRF